MACSVSHWRPWLSDQSWLTSWLIKHMQAFSRRSLHHTWLVVIYFYRLASVMEVLLLESLWWLQRLQVSVHIVHALIFTREIAIVCSMSRHHQVKCLRLILVTTAARLSKDTTCVLCDLWKHESALNFRVCYDSFKIVLMWSKLRIQRREDERDFVPLFVTVAFIFLAPSVIFPRVVGDFGLRQEWRSIELIGVDLL